MQNDYGIEIQKEPEMVMIPITDYEADKIALAKAQRRVERLTIANEQWKQVNTDLQNTNNVLRDKVKELNAYCDSLNEEMELHVKNVFSKCERIKELEDKLENVQNTMATDNTDLGMENFKLKERIKELERERNQIEVQDKVVIDELREEIKNLLCVNASQARSANALRDSMEAKIKELESRQPKWNFIKQDEDGIYYNLPEAEIEVRVTDGKLTWTDTMFQDNDGDFYWDEGGCDIIAWMPFPEAPTTEESSAVKEGM